MVDILYYFFTFLGVMLLGVCGVASVSYLVGVYRDRKRKKLVKNFYRTIGFNHCYRDIKKGPKNG